MAWLRQIKPKSIVISDYAKGAISPELAKQIIDLEFDKEVFVDTRINDISMYFGADWLSPNKHECSRMVKFIRERHPELPDDYRAIHSFARIDNLLLTRGKDGMALAAPNCYLHENAKNETVVDVTGAGDTAVATLAALRTLGCHTYRDILQICNELAGNVCMHKGTTVPTKTLEDYGY